MDEALEPAAEEPRVVAATASIIVAWKPHRMHCAELPQFGGGPSLAAWVFARFPETAPASFADVEGARAVDGGLVHRLDYETAGLVLFARNPEVRRKLLEAQEANRVEKTYRLQCSASEACLAGSKPLRGRPKGIDADEWSLALRDAGRLAEILSNRTIESLFRPYGSRGARVACLDLALAGSARRRGWPERPYVTELRSARAEGGNLVVTVALTRGFRHQIRAHFAWIGLPLLGDSLYGGVPRPSLGLVAAGIDFNDPETGLPQRFRDDSIAPTASLA